MSGGGEMWAGAVDWVIDGVCNRQDTPAKERTDKFVAPPVDVGVISTQTAQTARDEAIRRLSEKGFYYDRGNVKVRLKGT